VLHCGLYYQPGSLKAQLAVDGIREMISFCEKNQINHEVCGKIVVATDDREVGLLDNLADRGVKNGLNGLKFLTQEELKHREPNVRAKKALLVPQEGIVDYRQVMKVMAKHITNAGGDIYTNNKVMRVISLSGNKVLLQSESKEQAFDLVINCSGLFSDKTYSNLTLKKSPIKIVPFRGEYMHMAEEYKHLVNHLIYPVPDPKYPFLGVHFTRMINGGREVGPNAVLALKREGYKNTDLSLVDTLDSLTYKGFLNFFAKNTRFAMGEFLSSLSTRAFVAKARKLIPDIEQHMFSKGGTAGVRAQAISPKGELIMDFNIVKENNQIHVLNAPSPGATASIAIAKYIIDKYVS
jgi:L-2-hydroxyglutarate oxidase